ncbi:S-adenosyl-L-methionine-dependent methyltransferase [Diplogelasinospora grovesii]|uniref:S-adenosyl-L-methionine-dependent methyltransferase n=1 Tax=Diplogelasinospora grovesii TaxID=303347 RepID=A0AAN6N193_9PEZI|nr:S-adenosyl-L-methionine-dependent methyltransferase [Diplogelasinospora grovesii]
MSSSTAEERAVAKIYNSAIAAASIAAAWEVGLLDSLREHGKVNVPQFAAEHNLDGDSMRGVAVTLAVAEVVVVNYDAQDNTTSVIPGRLFDETYKTKSMFHWLTLGSGGLFCRMQHELRKDTRSTADSHRDPRAIAYACRELNRQFYDPVFWGVMEGLPYKFNSVVDLGCGSGERLMQILGRYPHTTAIGIDAAGPAIKFAEGEAQKRGFGDRLSFTVGDAREIQYGDGFANVDLLTSFLCGHDFWPRENCITTLRMLRSIFPKVKRFLLGDETRGLLHSAGSAPPVKQVTEDNVPIFALGLEFGHVLMDVYIPTMEEWYGVFEEGGWRCVKGHELQKPAFAVIFELEPID